MTWIDDAGIHYYGRELATCCLRADLPEYLLHPKEGGFTVGQLLTLLLMYKSRGGVLVRGRERLDERERGIVRGRQGQRGRLGQREAGPERERERERGRDV